MDLRAAADRLGVHYQTAYRWVRTGQLPAAKLGGSYDVSEADIARVLARRQAPAPPPPVGHVRNWAAQVARLYDAVVAGDELAARLVIDRLREARITAVPMIERLLVPVLRRVGDEWGDERLSIAVEHRASAICDRLLGRIDVHPRGRPRGVAVVATPVAEEHGLPATMAAVALRADRWQVHHLGTQVPPDDLRGIAQDVAAHVVVLSLTNPAGKAEAEEASECVQAGGRRVLVGQPGAPVSELLRLAAGARHPAASRVRRT